MPSRISLNLHKLNFSKLREYDAMNHFFLLFKGENDSWDFGSAAGFYVNATEGKWAKNYKMYDYVTKELPDLVNAMFPVNAEKKSITGHSMGGHGALICHLKNPGTYSSVSAFAPICNPTQVMISFKKELQNATLI